MKKGKRIVLAFSGLLVFTAAVHADMMPVSQQDAGYRHSSRACFTTYQQYANLSSPFGCPSISDLNLLPVKFLPDSDCHVGQTCQTPPVQILSDGQTSFSLCLYAMLGLGLCQSSPFVKKLSFGCIPEWYHNGGPFQIGHSHAIGPESLCAAPVVCFVQPVCTAEDLSPRYYKGAMVPLLRKSLFTPTVLDPRGPPLVL